MEDVKVKYYVVAMVDEDDPDEVYYVGTESWGTWGTEMYISPDIEDAKHVHSTDIALRMAEFANKDFADFGRAHIASVAISIKWTVV